MKRLHEVEPYVGDALPYLYDGGYEEKLRVCNVFAFHLFNDGPGEMEIDGIKHPIGPKTLVFLRPNQPHAFHIDAKHPLSSYNIYCDLWDKEHPLSGNRAFIYAPAPFSFETNRQAAMPTCADLDSLPSVFSLQSHPWLSESIVQLTRLFHDTLYYRDELVSGLMQSWLLGWYNAVHSRQPTDYRIVRLLAYLNENPEDRASIDEWAASCGMKRSYFHALFLRETGMAPKAYQHKLLMRRAANLLQESELTVTAIADRLGYPSIHPFTRHFTAAYGASPRQFRLNR
ncbi:helix-turn-helix transcriptional regulator [Paenibacillus agaridevorans]|uniref:helix-turn-helix transcriptional regulator n=1 Tax=Paenibacillus agaridevorans TaxID=171404 RepID=UPI001BE4881B|nr:AraC family transcriptional regulator [Paenibacillus agaridevorans]